MPNLNGTVSLRGIVDAALGVFTKGGSFNMTVQGGQDYENGFFFNSKNQIKEYIDDLVMTNRLWRILERIA